MGTSSTGTVHTNDAGKPRGIGQGAEAGIIVYGGAGHYGFSCDCEPAKVWMLSGKPGEVSDIDDHLARCPLRNRVCASKQCPIRTTAGGVGAAYFGEPFETGNEWWHGECYRLEEERIREAVTQ